MLTLKCRTNEYKTLKVTVQADNVLRSSTPPVLNEVNMLKHLGSATLNQDEADKIALKHLRLAEEILEIDNPITGGRHYCIVSQPQGNSVRVLQEFPGGILPRLIVKAIAHQLLIGLNWLHACAHVVHTCIDNDSIGLKEVEERESKNPSVPIITKDTNGTVSGVVYKSRPTRFEVAGPPVLTDFGQMRFILELMEGRNLFDPMDHEHRQYVYPLAMAQYIAYLGPPSPKLMGKSPILSKYFDGDGKYIGEAPIPKTSLEDFVTTISCEKEKKLFLRFIRRMLTWDPDERATTNEIFTGPWLALPPEEMPGCFGVYGEPEAGTGS
ncbi:Protein kinase domain-containing protein [Trichophyton interdigitale]|uniref:Protein kinase domain-containing protein n=1 Tax=Trichophyton interdigitale TaxID=101480 RepID=A0A9P4YKV7_9EURO|nr:Protein kinase domain-containing protein [Trichophyton interdigitale]KAF3900419.1 Protein kinase domain-containing protein [Trichophyton interdigitale]KAG8211215.1 Protein kinase domain-containing protein [Trichophyton interdigitale]